jgi:flagellin-like hook-associated protein FlgL
LRFLRVKSKVLPHFAETLRWRNTGFKVFWDRLDGDQLLQINSNASAMMALTNVNTVSDQLQQNIARLSSGLKITGPGDNPAGFVSAQQMGFQLAGIGQALNNTQDAVNLMKTADGGLSQIQNILQQLRTVALTAANYATSSTSSLQADQAQITSGLQSIDRIANSTEWGNTQLLTERPERRPASRTSRTWSACSWGLPSRVFLRRTAP